MKAFSSRIVPHSKYSQIGLRKKVGYYSTMRIRQMGFSSRLKAHRHILTLETLRFIVEYLKDGNAKQAAFRSGIPETYASRQGQWLKKLPIVKAALEREIDDRDQLKLDRAIAEIQKQMEICKEILGLNDETEE